VLQLEVNRLTRFWHRLAGKKQQVVLDTTHIKILHNGRLFELPLAKLNQLEHQSGWLSHRITLATDEVPSLTLNGYSSENLQAFSQQVISALLALMASSERWQYFEKSLIQRENKEHYLSSAEWRPIAELYQLSIQFLSLGIDLHRIDEAMHRKVLIRAQKLTAADVSELGRQLHNQQVVPVLLEKYAEFFDTIEKRPLTDNQRLACVTNDDHNLVVAGAGTGKTATLVGKAGFLVEANIAKASNVLLLAFGNKAAAEMNERIRTRIPTIGEDFTASTFHGLGNEILANHFGFKKAVNPFTEQQYQFSQFLNQTLDKLAAEDESYKALLVNYFASLGTPAKTELDFETIDDYHEFLSSCRLITLKGEWVKSVGELRIANYLTLNGVDYQYEADYQHSTRSVARRQYQPDFYLPGADLYIEYLGINESNETAPFVDQQSYLEDLAWKRELHSTKQTRMAELYSYQLSNGELQSELAKVLDEYQVERKTIPLEVIFDELRQQNEHQWQGFIELIKRFLGLFKEGAHSIETLIQKAAADRCDIERTGAFLSLFEPIYKAYQQELTNTETLDFSDMISNAVEVIEAGKFFHSYTHILVDEFQDISVGRAKLLQALLASKPNMRLFAVGDDWQSIYRFNGADIELFTQFNQTFTPSTAVPLDKTFRFNDKLHTVSSRFVSANPGQLQKQISTHTEVDSPALKLVDIKNLLPLVAGNSAREQKEQAYLKALNRSLSTFNRSAAKVGKSVSVLIIGRFRQENMRVLTGINFNSLNYPNLEISYVTAHGSKGLEADYVVLFGVDEGSFPSSRENDELIDLVLPNKESYLYAEERRLFYVALTRAKQFIYVLFDSDQTSPFLTEINRYGGGLVDSKLANSFAKWPCPKCQSGTLRTLESRYKKTFYKCSHEPACDTFLKSCKHCNAPLQEHVQGFKFCMGCGEVELGCLRCGTGTMVARCENDPNRETFYGCNRFRRGADDSCGENIRVEEYEKRLLVAKKYLAVHKPQSCY